MEPLNKYKSIFIKNTLKFKEELSSFFSELTFTLEETDLQDNIDNYISNYFYDISPILLKIVTFVISLEKPIILFKDLDLSPLLQNPLHRESIHNYLYILYFCSYQYLTHHPEKELTDEDTSAYKEIVSSYYQSKQSTTVPQETESSSDSTESNSAFAGLPGLGGLFGDNSGMFGNLVGNIAKDVMSEINVNDLGNPSDLLSNPMDLLGMITGKGGKNNKLSNLFNTITEKITKTMESSDIDQEQLVNEAKSFMGNMGGLGGLSGLSGLGGLGNVANTMKVSQTQERLRKKLEARKQLAATNSTNTTEIPVNSQQNNTSSTHSSKKKKNKKKRKKKH